MKKIVILFSIVSLSAHAYKQECREPMPHKKYAAPFEGGRIDYVITVPTDMMVVDYGRIQRYCYVQLEPQEKALLIDILSAYPADTIIDDALIATLSPIDAVTGKVLKDFQKITYHIERPVTLDEVRKALQNQQ